MAEFAAVHGLACSVGRTGVCWDNAQQESYWASLKVKFYNRRSWAARSEAMTASGTGSSGSTTADGATLRWKCSAPYGSRSSTVRWQKPPDPLSTVRGQAQVPLWARW